MSDIISVSESQGGFRILYEDGTTSLCTRYGGRPLAGHNESYFVVEDRDYFFVLDADGDVCGSIQRLAGSRVSSVTSDSVVIRDGQYLKRYDMQGNLTGTRQVL
jgi:hypothetical protein